MKKKNSEKIESTPVYEEPRLEVVSLRGDEVLGGSCKDISGAGPSLTCQDGFGGTCSDLGS